MKSKGYKKRDHSLQMERDKYRYKLQRNLLYKPPPSLTVVYDEKSPKARIKKGGKNYERDSMKLYRYKKL